MHYHLHCWFRHLCQSNWLFIANGYRVRFGGKGSALWGSARIIQAGGTAPDYTWTLSLARWGGIFSLQTSDMSKEDFLSKSYKKKINEPLDVNLVIAVLEPFSLFIFSYCCYLFVTICLFFFIGRCSCLSFYMQIISLISWSLNLTYFCGFSCFIDTVGFEIVLCVPCYCFCMDPRNTSD